LALLSSALECQRAIEERNVSRRASRTEAKALLAKETRAPGGSCGDGKDAGEDDFKDDDDDDKNEEEEEEEETPRVVWVARTHDQLEHAVREFKRLPYRPMMSLRLSRERCEAASVFFQI